MSPCIVPWSDCQCKSLYCPVDCLLNPYIVLWIVGVSPCIVQWTVNVNPCIVPWTVDVNPHITLWTAN